MGLFKRDPQKQAERQRRRARKKEAAAAAARAKAQVYEAGARNSRASITGRDKQGRQVRQDVEIEDPRVDAILQRLAELEKNLAEERAENEEMRERLDEMEKESQDAYDGFVSQLAAMSGWLRAMVQLVNVNDRVVNPIGLVISEGIDALADQADGATQQTYRLGSLGAKLWAYYDPEQGLGSVWSADQAQPAQGAQGN